MEQPSDFPNPDHPKISVTHEGEHHNDYGNASIPVTKSSMLYAFCASVNSCNLGYDVGVSTEAGRLVQQYFGLSRIQREIFLGSINFWAIFGALGAQFFTDRYGRRRTFLVAAVGFILGVVIEAVSNSFGVLMFGRLFVGLGVGVGLAIDPLYIAEVTPARHRGELVTWSEIALNVGLIFGFSTGITLAAIPDDREWRYMFGLGAILPIIMIFLVLFIMPESPRWLVANGQAERATEILSKIYPRGFDVKPVVDDIQEAIEREQAAEQAVGWRVIFFPTPAIRRMLIVGVGIAIAQQAVGIDAIQYYLLDVLRRSGIDALAKQNAVLMFLGFIKLIFVGKYGDTIRCMPTLLLTCVSTVVGGKFFDRRGRRPLFFISLLGMAAALLMISIAFFVNQNVSPAFVVTGLALYLMFFSTGMGPGAWLVPAEVFAICIRGKAMSVATFANRVTATLMASTFLSTADGIGWGGFFLLLCIICLIVSVFLYFFLPETKGRSLEDMSNLFAEITGDKSILEAEARILERRERGGLELPPHANPWAPSSSPTISEDAEVI